MPAQGFSQDEQERLEDEAVAWVVRLTSGEATETDQAAVAAWRRHSPAHEQAFQNVQRLWGGMEGLRDRVVTGESVPFVQSVCGPLPSKASQPSLERGVRRGWIKWGGIAAAIAGLAFVCALESRLITRLTADYHTDTGEQAAAVLADGSLLQLNTQAAASVHYTGTVRRVELLEGEAAFRVAKDATRPFVVHTRGGQVRAVGTEFLVHETREAVVVTVMEGVVAVSAPGAQMDSSTRVHAGQRVRYSASGVTEVESVDLRAVTAWQRGKLIFESTPLATVVEEINRYRPGQVALLGARLADHRVSGVFDLDRLDTALTAIEHTLPVTTVRLTSRFVFFR